MMNLILNFSFCTEKLIRLFFNFHQTRSCGFDVSLFTKSIHHALLHSTTKIEVVLCVLVSLIFYFHSSTGLVSDKYDPLEGHSSKLTHFKCK